MSMYHYLLYYLFGLAITVLLKITTALLIKGTYLILKDIFIGNFFHD